jgi:hypothetical protein
MFNMKCSCAVKGLGFFYDKLDLNVRSENQLDYAHLFPYLF